MLQNLFIENYALIEKLDIRFSKGFSVITGETGAGKSIMLGALSLILGSRADTKVLKNENRKCIIEGCFAIEGYNLENFFKENDLDFETQTILRREIAPSGKSRAFINDTPVNLNILKQLGDRLVNIHSQHETITLNDANFQLAVVDSYAGNDTDLKAYQVKYIEYKKHVKELHDLKDIDSKAKMDMDYVQFQFDELEKANLQIDEQQQLEDDMKLLSHAEEIKLAMIEASEKLENSEINVLDLLSDIQKSISKIALLHPNTEELSERITSSFIELKDLSRELNAMGEAVNVDPFKLNEVSERLDLIYQLQQKHRLQSLEELIALRDRLDDQLQSINTIDEQIEVLSKDIKIEEDSLNVLAMSLSESRLNASPAIEKEIVNKLQQLGMPDARFSILLEPTPELGNEGIDKVRFLFNANKGSALNEISRIASGGELSRLMLAVKSMISGRQLLPTIVFDEIDMGVSGEVASKVGEILFGMTKNMQVISITHLPQIAGKGDSHFRVYKDNRGDTTHSVIVELSKEERILEIAKMMSGAEVTESAIENARVLLSN